MKQREVNNHTNIHYLYTVFIHLFCWCLAGNNNNNNNNNIDFIFQFLKGLCSPQLAQLFWAGYLN